MRLVHDLSDAQRGHIGLCGFGYLLQIPDIHVNHNMLTTLVEHFHSEYNTFHLLVGEMMINPKDIYRILRIPFDWRAQQRDMFMTRPLIGRLNSILE